MFFFCFLCLNQPELCWQSGADIELGDGSWSRPYVLRIRPPPQSPPPFQDGGHRTPGPGKGDELELQLTRHKFANDIIRHLALELPAAYNGLRAPRAPLLPYRREGEGRGGGKGEETGEGEEGKERGRKR